ncbi:hypothetical protein PCASD_03266 [Puccinia coronata f. sp. avenae]|uniref:Uncharacterized protein n=1 Tax=Puccinia coronata f. sp. avenae TaxID=200324 RepID=A0A2N5S548_9BASI|nr:hypothetical protein PCASD_25066 [Puccinia coronata f. sp. avenae]PLW48213.1 hypothetical protein PCASD_03266 [Puccinia coronata f. sp. avenae]
MSPGVLSHSSLAICNSHGDPGSHRCQGKFAHQTLTATLPSTNGHQGANACVHSMVYAFVRLAQNQQVGPPICQAGTNPAGRSTYSRSWYQPSKQVYLLAELVPAQRAGLPACNTGASLAGLPRWCQPSGLATLVPA